MRRLHSPVSLRNLKTLFLSTFERRRIALAAIVTMLVLPLMMVNGGGDKKEGVVAVVTTTTQIDSGLGGEPEDGSLEPIILGGPSPIVQDGSAQIAYPSSNLTGVQAIASFSNFDNAPEIVCYHAPSTTRRQNCRSKFEQRTNDNLHQCVSHISAFWRNDAFAHESI